MPSGPVELVSALGEERLTGHVRIYYILPKVLHPLSPVTAAGLIIPADLAKQ